MARSISAAAVLACLLAGPLAGPAAAVSVEDLFSLKANGLSDEVLVALIETDGSVFRLSPEDVVALHKRGLGEKVILAMIASARRRMPSASESLPASPGETRDSEGARTGYPSVVSPISQTIVQHVEVSQPARVIEVPVVVPFPIAVPVVPAKPVKPPKPVYWGFGGKPRPDSWQPAPQKDETPEPNPKRPR